jgi:hypothetical protein
MNYKINILPLTNVLTFKKSLFLFQKNIKYNNSKKLYTVKFSTVIDNKLIQDKIKLKRTAIFKKKMNLSDWKIYKLKAKENAKKQKKFYEKGGHKQFKDLVYKKKKLNTLNEQALIKGNLNILKEVLNQLLSHNHINYDITQSIEIVRE